MHNNRTKGPGNGYYLWENERLLHYLRRKAWLYPPTVGQEENLVFRSAWKDSQADGAMNSINRNQPFPPELFIS
jgi:hypothetical protein